MAASEAGVDAIGFVFYEKSPRYIEPMKAASIIRALPPFVSAVGLFVNPEQSCIDQVLKHCALGVIQLHGDETPEFCAAQERRVIKAVAVSEADDLKKMSRYSCSVLLDAKAPKGVYGGTGHSFDWTLLGDLQHEYPLILAGGLNAENVQAAMRQRDWFAVDVSTGVESSPGVKSADKIKQFVANVNTVQQEG